MAVNTENMITAKHTKAQLELVTWKQVAFSFISVDYRQPLWYTYISLGVFILGH